MEKHTKNKLEKIKEKYAQVPPAVKASIWFVVCNVLQKGISMVTVPIFTRLLTTEEYGILSIFQSWYSIIFIFATLNLVGGVYNNAMIKYAEFKDEFTSSMQGLTTLTTLIFILIYSLNLNFWNRLFTLDTKFVVIIFIQILFEPAFLFWSARQRYEYKYKKLVIITLVMSVLSPVLGICAIYLTKYKLEARIFSFALVSISIGLIMYVYQYIKGKMIFNKKYWLWALKFNIPLIPHYLSSIVLGQADRIMINSIEGYKNAAIYSVAYNIAMLMNIIVNAINSSFVPFTYNCIKDKKYEKIQKTSISLLLIISLPLFILMLFAPEVIKIMAPLEYYEARWIIPPVAASVFLTFMYCMFSNVEFYFEANTNIMLASVTAAISNIVLNWLLIPQFGYIAAGYTTMFCYIILVVMHYISMTKVLKKNGIKQIYSFKLYFGSVILFVLISLFINILYNNTIARYIVILSIIIVTCKYNKKIIKVIKSLK